MIAAQIFAMDQSNTYNETAICDKCDRAESAMGDLRQAKSATVRSVDCIANICDGSNEHNPQKMRSAICDGRLKEQCLVTALGYMGEKANRAGEKGLSPNIK